MVFVWQVSSYYEESTEGAYWHYKIQFKGPCF